MWGSGQHHSQRKGNNPRRTQCKGNNPHPQFHAKVNSKGRNRRIVRI